MYKFISSLPSESPEGLWALQNFLLTHIEGLIGNKDPIKKIYQPVFGEGHPYICNTPSLDGAFAVLSLNAKVYWPTTLYELAHETVHLLNPKIGNANVLEEGVATIFSEEMSKRFTNHAMTSKLPSYRDAANLANELPEPFYDSIKKLRLKAGALYNVSESDICSLFPNLDVNLAQKLCSEFVR